MPAREQPIPMTVDQIREAIAVLPGDTVLKWSRWDSEYDHTYIYGIGEINPEGGIREVLIDSFAGWGGDDEEIEELTAERDTEAAEARETLYHDDSVRY